MGLEKPVLSGIDRQQHIQIKSAQLWHIPPQISQMYINYNASGLKLKKIILEKHSDQKQNKICHQC